MGAGAGARERGRGGEGRQRIVAPRSIFSLFTRNNSHTNNFFLKLGILSTGITLT